MGKPTGFLEYARELPPRRPVTERINDWFEVYHDFEEEKTRTQGARCMDCGLPFCHTGCPLNNIIPDWNDLVYRGRWRDAIRVLHATNNFPEFTGRICPAPCEAACVLGINEPPVAIKHIEKTIVDHAFRQGWIKPEPPEQRTGKRVAVVGSGPAGLAAAQQLARAGHDVTVFEKADRIGGLLRYGIPDFKMEKHLIDRRIEQMEAEGVRFEPNTHVGVTVPGKDLPAEFDAVLLAGGAEQPRDLARARPGIERHSFRDGISAAAKQKVRRMRGPRSDPRHRQKRRHHRRRRYRGRLPRDIASPEGRFRSSVRDHAVSSDGARAAHAVAAVASATALGNIARRGRNSRLEHRHDGIHGRRAGQCEKAARHPLRRAAHVRAAARNGVHDGRRSRTAGHGFHRSGSVRAARSNWACDWTLAATSRPVQIIRRRFPECSRRAICGAASRWWYGPSRRAAKPRRPSAGIFPDTTSGRDSEKKFNKF